MRVPNRDHRARSPRLRSSPAIPDPRAALAATRTWQTIVIDPGHGGDDVGVRSAKGIEEKQLTLDIARRLRAMVENRLGLRVILTRDDDRALGLDERAAVANNGKANLLLSLHVNGSRGPEQSGAEVFHLQLDRESAEVIRAAAAEGADLPTIDGGVRRLDLIPWDLAQARHLDESSVLASVLQEELQRQVPMSGHPIRQAPMRLLAAANMPAALVEVAYLTNPQQEARLNTDDFKTDRRTSAVQRYRAVSCVVRGVADTMSVKAWWLAFIGGLAVLVLIAVSIARMYGPPRTAPSEASPPSAPSAPKETRAHHGHAVLRHTRRPGARADAARGAAGRDRRRTGPADPDGAARRSPSAAVCQRDSLGNDAARVLRHRAR